MNAILEVWTRLTAEDDLRTIAGQYRLPQALLWIVVSALLSALIAGGSVLLLLPPGSRDIIITLMVGWTVVVVAGFAANVVIWYVAGQIVGDGPVRLAQVAVLQGALMAPLIPVLVIINVVVGGLSAFGVVLALGMLMYTGFVAVRALHALPLGRALAAAGIALLGVLVLAAIGGLLVIPQIIDPTGPQ
ncbi:MAG: hypothetical protein ACFB51_05880 [Anaerolineae bacterium]